MEKGRLVVEHLSMHYTTNDGTQVHALDDCASRIRCPHRGRQTGFRCTFCPGPLDELLEILMRDKAWSEELASKTYIAILDIIEPPPVKVADGQIPPVDPVVATYRRRLSSLVLS